MTKENIDVKEAIEFLELQKYSISEFKKRYYLNEEKERKDCNKTFNDIILLLQRGEKFVAMWGEFQYYISGIAKVLPNKMNDLEQKYFPKGGKVG